MREALERPVIVGAVAVAALYYLSKSNTQFAAALFALSFCLYYGSTRTAESKTAQQTANITFDLKTLCRDFREAARNNDFELIRQTLDGPLCQQIIDSESQNQKTALHFAVNTHASNSVILLVGKGADINKKDIKGKTPLYYAVKNLVAVKGQDYVPQLDTLLSLLAKPGTRLFDLKLKKDNEPVNKSIKVDTAQECLDLLQGQNNSMKFDRVKRMLSKIASSAPRITKEDVFYSEPTAKR